MKEKLLIAFCFLFFPTLAPAQIGQLRLLRPYDGSSANILSSNCPGLDFRGTVESFEYTGSELRFRIQLPNNVSGYSAPEIAEYYLALEQFVDPDVDLGPQLRVRLTYRPTLSFPYEPDSTCSGMFNIEPGAATDIPIESGWWVDYLKVRRLSASGLFIDRAAGRIDFRYLTFDGPASIDDPRFPTHPGIWFAGGAPYSSDYQSVPMRSFTGGVCIPCILTPRESERISNRLLFFPVSPTTAVVAPPNEPPRLMEIAALPSEQYPNRSKTSLTGNWIAFTGDDALFGGFPIEIGTEQVTGSTLTYPLEFAFGSGRAECGAGDTLSSYRCIIYLRFDGLDHDFFLFEIPKQGIGNQKLYRQEPSGKWRTAMIRTD